MSETPISPLRQRMLEDMSVRRLSSSPPMPWAAMRTRREQQAATTMYPNPTARVSF